MIDSFVAGINAHMQTYRVLCVTTKLSSNRMWDEYAKNHTGVAIQIKPNLSKDSKFRLFHEVKYEGSRPTLYENPRNFLSDRLFGDQDKTINKCLEEIIYTKTHKWSYENEWRLVIPVSQSECSWDTLPYHAEEIAELYLGSQMSKSERDEIIFYAKKRNHSIAIFDATRTNGGKVSFKRL